ncbi:MAG: hypothetical protein A4E48_02661 [Methanosaeta sp. PtaU1.Bin060]|jgi:hypothetical protein|nr:MAG: hypothetical protein A4E48_02661 [Methanosaeta sp. PtaU1.Bin060]
MSHLALLSPAVSISRKAVIPSPNEGPGVASTAIECALNPSRAREARQRARRPGRNSSSSWEERPKPGLSGQSPGPSPNSFVKVRRLDASNVRGMGPPHQLDPDPTQAYPSHRQKMSPKSPKSPFFLPRHRQREASFCRPYKILAYRKNTVLAAINVIKYRYYDIYS